MTSQLREIQHQIIKKLSQKELSAPRSWARSEGEPGRERGKQDFL